MRVSHCLHKTLIIKKCLFPIKLTTCEILFFSSILLNTWKKPTRNKNKNLNKKYETIIFFRKGIRITLLKKQCEENIEPTKSSKNITDYVHKTKQITRKNKFTLTKKLVNQEKLGFEKSTTKNTPDKAKMIS